MHEKNDGWGGDVTNKNSSHFCVPGHSEKSCDTFYSNFNETKMGIRGGQDIEGCPGGKKEWRNNIS